MIVQSAESIEEDITANELGAEAELMNPSAELNQQQDLSAALYLDLFDLRQAWVNAHQSAPDVVVNALNDALRHPTLVLHAAPLQVFLGACSV